mmetsp:Transcript_6919/g.16942  ORF Transcript_6919/g.16942 Transcript_6919/m.16942 type:complete len:225 (-) Transcript_6919:42-716(-)
MCLVLGCHPRLGTLAPLAGHKPPVITAAPFGFAVGTALPPGAHTLPPEVFSWNRHERNVIETYLRDKGISAADLFERAARGLADGTYTLPETFRELNLRPLRRHSSSRETVESSLWCATCARTVFTALIPLWRSKLAASELPPEVSARPSCWYGWNCRTQQHSISHAQRYSQVAELAKLFRHDAEADSNQSLANIREKLQQKRCLCSSMMKHAGQQMVVVCMFS